MASKRRDRRADILAAIRRSGRPMTAGEFLMHPGIAGLRSPEVRRLLDELVAGGELVRVPGSISLPYVRSKEAWLYDFAMDPDPTISHG